MAQSDPHATFSGYTVLMIFAGLCALPQIGVASLIISAAALYSGACFMNGYTAGTPKRRRK